MATRAIGGTPSSANPITFTLSPGMAPAAPLMRMLAQFDREKVEAFAEISIALLDMMDGDLDEDGQCTEDEISCAPVAGAYAMPTGPGCEIADAGETAWIEWTTLRGSQKAGPITTGHDQHGNPLHEDDEEADDSGQCTEDETSCGSPSFRRTGPGCTISDPDYCLAGDDRVTSGAIGGPGVYLPSDGPGDADDAEHWSMTSNVPMPPVVSAEHNVFTDERVPLGIANLQSSFRTNGRKVRSADSGRTLRTTALDDERKPGSPV